MNHILSEAVITYAIHKLKIVQFSASLKDGDKKWH